MPISFKELLPAKSVLGFLKIYIIPKGKKTTGKNKMYWVITNENIAIVSDIIDAIQIINREAFGDNFDNESPSIISWSIWPENATEAIVSIIKNSNKVRLGK